ncbi:ABC transporter ATP-binding protein [Acidimangrovimonas sediminis]|uniref:ABC transporter ATP-binding protein n=1 Tax=Acidimangrovimonas sediminis TaxID=2056283 RepID=UPI000C80E051|nr:sn-glycerol-3-phosphate ABC transporter ATP-binding protein UgpC [Acidimangrovimonas sediminis]
MSSLTLSNLCKDFGTTRILHDINLEVADGEFVALVGPSGCGKSTLLRMIAGLEGATGGRIEIDGRQVNGVPPRDRDIAMVFQNYALYPHMTVAENMSFSLKLRGLGAEEMKREVHRAAGILGLEALLDRKPRALSGGQRQRVAMGRAIVRDPKVFLFDEPLSNLDAKLRVQMRTEIRKLQQTLGATVIYVTHDQIEAMTMADRIVLMRDGHIEQQGAPLELFDRPETAFVAGFIGSPSMNLVHGSVVQTDTGMGFRTGSQVSLPLSRPARPGPAIWGIRPEHLHLGEAGPIAARVELVEPMGSETIVIVSVEGVELQVLLRERTALSRGDAVRLTVPGEALHLFDAETEKRIA